MSEFELLHAFRSDRSEAAFAELVRRYAGLVYSVAKRRLANGTLAEDITQLVFIRLAKTPPNVQSHGELVAWLHRTTVHVTIDAWRSESRRRNREQLAAVMETTPTENAIWEELSPDLDEALNQLKD
ncbi:MAG: polymerase, sigma-24 subunit, subfamily, partial [Pedosphaera sp.]|nr:polymerase, sigma-24 subunit, subfamily [Pedosphaera sp.]